MTTKYAADLELAQRVVAGDESAATDLFQQLSGEMYGFARKMLRNPEQAEESDHNGDSEQDNAEDHPGAGIA